MEDGRISQIAPLKDIPGHQLRALPCPGSCTPRPLRYRSSGSGRAEAGQLRAPGMKPGHRRRAPHAVAGQYGPGRPAPTPGAAPSSARWQTADPRRSARSSTVCSSPLARPPPRGAICGHRVIAPPAACGTEHLRTSSRPTSRGVGRQPGRRLAAGQPEPHPRGAEKRQVAD
jgi:hypothetical protein